MDREDYARLQRTRQKKAHREIIYDMHICMCLHRFGFGVGSGPPRTADEEKTTITTPTRGDTVPERLELAAICSAQSAECTWRRRNADHRNRPGVVGQERYTRSGTPGVVGCLKTEQSRADDEECNACHMQACKIANAARKLKQGMISIERASRVVASGAMSIAFVLARFDRLIYTVSNPT
ncbi:uncharacterized protein SPSK_00914 [Sporothrix schenckii 1099-18]|uniref:Uncharacterized protein n=1 Tax=Sporothrix schenckii 1099-18 TaxID=1397361 RepID=A0A0F2LXT6_SPOSC|nr:uncharacterized protein SPSK_00914 [Sporothrix schenckii 1099-18]KJR81649.1 hypothetical protein SPSK_00914 [Sporothrix schenckii 1099-18]